MKKYLVVFFMLAFTIGNTNAVVTIGKSLNKYVKGHIEDAGVNKYKFFVTFMASTNSLPTTPVMLLKFMDDTTVELSGERTRSSREMVSGTNMFWNDEAVFILNQKQFEQIVKGIKKIRINSQPKFFERTWKKDKLGKKLYKDYQKSRF